jgi:hypothetical protein
MWRPAARPTRRVLVIAASAFLAAGLALRPAAPPPAPPEDTQAPLLQQVVQERQAQATFQILQEVAADTIRFAAHVSAPERPLTEWSDWDPALQARGPVDGYAVVVGLRSLLAYGQDLRDDVPVHVRFSDGRTMAARITARFPGYALALLVVEDTGELPVPSRIVDGPKPGDAVVATAPGADGDIVAPLFVSSVRPGGATTTTALESFRGMPVFGTDRALVGIVADVDGETRVVSIAAAMAPPVEAPPAPPALGVSLAERAGAAPDSPRTIVVTDVDAAGRAFRAGLRTGDVILDIDGEPLSDLPQAIARMAGASTDIRIRVRRGRRTLAATVPMEAGQGP